MVVVDCMGNGRSRGRMHGEAARGLVFDALQRWVDATASTSGIRIAENISLLLSKTRHLAAMETLLPDLVEEMRGIAETADVPFDQIAVYN